MESTPPPPSPPVAAPRRRRWGLVVAALILVLLLAGGWWIYTQFHARPFEPTALSAPEQAVLDGKIAVLEQAPATRADKTLALTEREINALLAHNTGLADTTRLSLEQDAVSALWNIPVADEVPILGGKTLRGKVKFNLRLQEGRLAMKVQDVTVFGLSLPNAWLGGIKNVDLAEKYLADDQAFKAFVAGIESFAIEDGRLSIVLAE